MRRSRFRDLLSVRLIAHGLGNNLHLDEKSIRSRDQAAAPSGALSLIALEELSEVVGVRGLTLVPANASTYEEHTEALQGSNRAAYGPFGDAEIGCE
jgi:hypothetical protein